MELEPCLAAGTVEQRLQPGAGGRRHAQRHAALACGICQHHVGARPGQVGTRGVLRAGRGADDVRPAARNRAQGRESALGHVRSCARQARRRRALVAIPASPRFRPHSAQLAALMARAARGTSRLRVTPSRLVPAAARLPSREGLDYGMPPRDNAGFPGAPGAGGTIRASASAPPTVLTWTGANSSSGH